MNIQKTKMLSIEKRSTQILTHGHRRVHIWPWDQTNTLSEGTGLNFV